MPSFEIPADIFTRLSVFYLPKVSSVTFKTRKNISLCFKTSHLIIYEYCQISICASCRYLFWTDRGKTPKIERMWMDGSNRTVIIDERKIGIKWPYDIAYDNYTSRIYWTNVYYIGSSDIDGNNIRRFYHQAYIQRPDGILVTMENIYFTDWKVRGVVRVNKTDTKQFRLLWAYANSTTKPMKVALISTLKSGCK